MSKCIECQQEIDTGGDNLRCGSCKVKSQNKPIGMQGWICPVCGAGNSPYNPRCACQGYPPMKITC
jgi:hypothetical protein